MELNLITQKQNFKMAKIVNKTKVWDMVAEQTKKYDASKQFMDKNLDYIGNVYPDKYLHTYEFDKTIIFKISSIKNHFLAFWDPMSIKHKDSYIHNTPVGILTALRLHLEKAGNSKKLK